MVEEAAGGACLRGTGGGLNDTTVALEGGVPLAERPPFSRSAILEICLAGMASGDIPFAEQIYADVAGRVQSYSGNVFLNQNS